MSKSRPPSGTRRARQRPRPMREAKILGALALIVLLITVGAAALRGGEQPLTFATEGELIRADSPTLGPADAPVTLVEFLDPECESCRAMYPIVKEVLAQYEGQVRFVVRYFPLHQNSVLAAAATEAAGEQGQYWQMQQLLFEQQPKWGEQRTPQTELFVAYARQLGLDEEQFVAGLANAEYARKAERDRGDGIALGVQGTPTFFVNGRRLEQLGREALVSAIEAGLRESQ